MTLLEVGPVVVQTWPPPCDGLAYTLVWINCRDGVRACKSRPRELARFPQLTPRATFRAQIQACQVSNVAPQFDHCHSDSLGHSGFAILHSLSYPATVIPKSLPMSMPMP